MKDEIKKVKRYHYSTKNKEWCFCYKCNKLFDYVKIDDNYYSKTLGDPMCPKCGWMLKNEYKEIVIVYGSGYDDYDDSRVYTNNERQLDTLIDCRSVA